MAEFGDEIPKAMQPLLKSAGISQKQMMSWGKAVAKGGADGKKAMTEVAKTLAKVEDATLRNKLGVQIFGTMYEDQGDNIVKTLINAEKKTISLRKNQDQLNNAIKKMEADPAVKWSKAMSDLKTAMQPLLGIIADLVSGIAQWISQNPKLAATIAAVGTALGILSGVILTLAPAWAAITSTAALFGVSIGALLGPIGLAGLAIGGLAAAVIAYSGNLPKADEETRRFGNTVSTETAKAAEGYLALRDKALVNLAKLRTASGEEARKIVAETAQIFAQMGDKITAALNEDKIAVQKAAASLIEEVPEAIAPAVSRITDSAIKSIDTQIRKVEEANATIHKGLTQYGGDIKKMPQEFAKAYQQALKDLDQTSQTFVKKLGDLNSFMENIAAEQGKITVKGAKDWLSEINKAYDHATAAAKKWAKDQRTVYEEQFANGHITKAAYDEMIRIVDFAEQKKLTLASEARAKSITQLEKSLSDEAHLYDLKTGKAIAVYENHKDAILASEEDRIKRGKELNRAYFQSLIDESEKGAAALKKSQEALIKSLGNAGTQSITQLVNMIQQGGDKARLAAEALATKTKDGFKIDLGAQGQVSINSFIDGLKKGQYTARDVSLAHMNQLRNIYGSGEFSTEGLKAIESFTKGLRSQKPAEIAKQIGLDLKSKMQIDLGPYGKVSAESFAKGLSDGTYSFDSIYAYFHQSLKKGTTFDLSAEGKKNIETLRLGMQSRSIDVQDAAYLLGLDIKKGVNVDLRGQGLTSIYSLLSGFQQGKISVSQFVEGMNLLIKNGAKLDLTTEGKATGDSVATGLNDSRANIEYAAKLISDAAERQLGSTTDGGGGEKAANQMRTSLLNYYSPISFEANKTKNMVAQVLGETSDGGGGKKAGSQMQSGLVQYQSPIRQAANQNKSAVEKALGSATDGGGGKQASSQFVKGVVANKGRAGTEARNVASNAKSNLQVSGAHGIGSNLSSSFASGISSGRSGVISAALGIARAAISAAKSALGIKSPSRVFMGLAEDTGKGFEIGLKNQISAITKQAQAMADAAVFDVPSSFARSRLGAISRQSPFTLTINNNFSDVSIRSDADIDKLASRVSQVNAREFQRLLRTVAGVRV